MSPEGPTRRQVVAGLTLAAWPGVAAAAEPADDLVGRMTLEEKAGQLTMVPDTTRPDFADVNPAEVARDRAQLERDIAAGRVGGLVNGAGVAGARALQRVAVERGPHGVPLLFAADVIHGMRTQFPVPLGEAASFEPELAERTARAAAEEATALGLHWTFAPMVDVARDQRWGRVCEGAGEDPWLGSRFAAARVRGFQGRSLRDPTSLLATPKHFAAYGAVQGGMEYGPVDLSDATLREVHLPPFRAAFDAGALSTMAAFNDVNGVPATGNRRLLTGVLRDEWRFPGIVVTDAYSEAKLVAHGYAADERDAVRRAILAGCDLSIMGGLYMKHLPDLVRSGEVPEAVLDRSVRRVLRVKEALGLFDDPYRSLDPRRARTAVRRPAAVALAREAAVKSIVLLKNEGGLLPLRPDRPIALIGPFAEDRVDIMGPWSPFADKRGGVSIADGLRASLRDPAMLACAEGSGVEAPIAGGVEAAVRAARGAEVVLLAIGENSAMSGEAGARTDIGVPAPQQALAEAVAATGKPLVVLLRHGRALALTGAVRDAPAILATWFLGHETGHAVADLLFGRASPSGRLPVSFPLASGQQPLFYNHRPTGSPHRPGADPRWDARWRDAPFEPLYPFGYGLTYSTVEYGPTGLSAPALPWTGVVEASADLSNIGRREVVETAQLYVRDLVASVSRPVRELKGVRRVTLRPGETKRVAFRLTRADLAFVREDGSYEAEPGAFDVWIAPSSAAGAPARLELTSPRPPGSPAP